VLGHHARRQIGREETDVGLEGGFQFTRHALLPSAISVRLMVWVGTNCFSVGQFFPRLQRVNHVLRDQRHEARPFAVENAKPRENPS